MNKTITITFGDQAENHVGMQKIGNLSDSGFDINDLTYCSNIFTALNTKSDVKANMELYNLNTILPLEFKTDDAYILIIRNGLDVLLHNVNKTVKDLFTEQNNLNPDTKVYSYGSVKNKLARYNLCFSDYDQISDFNSGKGTIINFNKVPYTNYIRECLPVLLGEKAKNLQGEGNYYYDIKKTGISHHGDAERRKVVAFRLGASIPLVFTWFHKFKPISETVKFILNEGDMYVMSEKAVGNDWKKSSLITLRHAAGADKYITIKKKK